MARLVSLQTKIQQIHGLADTKDASEWETNFIKSVWAWSYEGKFTTGISDKQIAVIERIWEKHFA